MLLTMLWEFLTSDMCMSMIQIPGENIPQCSLPFQKEAEAVTHKCPLCWEFLRDKGLVSQILSLCSGYKNF